MGKTDKITRMLSLYNQLINGEEINKSIFSIEHNINERTFDRDVEDIRLFLSELYENKELIYDRSRNVYCLTNCNNSNISTVEIIALLKIIVTSRAFIKEEMRGLVSTLTNLVNANEGIGIKEIINSEMKNYAPPIHSKAILKMNWDLNQCILKRNKILLSYCKATGEVIDRVVSPISITFSEYYFYLIAFRDDFNYEYPAFFRVDRIKDFILTNEKYDEKLLLRYDIGEMIKGLKFMNGGDLVKVQLRMKSNIKDVIIDQLPNAEIIRSDDEITELTAMVFEAGFIKWLLRNGTTVEVVQPLSIREKMKEEAGKILRIYE